MPRNEKSIRVKGHAGLDLKPYIRLTIKGRRYKWDVREQVRLANSTAEDALIHHAERFAFWRRMLAERTRERRAAESDLSQVSDLVWIQWKNAVRNGERESMSEQEITRESRLDPRVVQAREALDLALYQEDICRTMVEAFDHRKSAFTKLFRKPSPHR